MRFFKNYLILFAMAMSIISTSAFAAQIRVRDMRAITPGAKRPVPIAIDRGNNEQPPTFYVNIKVDHEDCTYEEGDLMTVTARTNRSGYLYIFVRDCEGDVYLLYPNKFQRDNYIEANRNVQIPDSRMDFAIETQAPFGKEILQAIVTMKPLDDRSLESFQKELFNKVDKSSAKSIEKSLGQRYNSRRPWAVEKNRTTSTSSSSYDENDFAEHSIEIVSYSKGRVPNTRTKRIFVGICVSQYQDSKIPSLPACQNDIVEVGNYFANNCGVDLEDSVLLVDDKVTKETISILFNDYLPNHTNPGDEVIVYWTGHGARYSDVDGDEATGGLDATLVLYDSKISDPQTHLVDDEFGRWVQNLSGRKVLFLLDACYSAGMATNAKGAFSKEYQWKFGFRHCAIMKDLGQTNLAVIASSSNAETSLVRPDGKMSVMTYFMLDCLQSNPSITHKELYRKIKEPVNDYVQRNCHTEQTVSFQDDMDSPMIVNPSGKGINMIKRGEDLIKPGLKTSKPSGKVIKTGF